MASLFSDLQARGLIQDSTDNERLAALLNSGSISFYCGFDPTSDSLHVGSLLPLLFMRRLQLAGHKPLLLLGTATGMIGDPSGKTDERKLLSTDTVKNNALGLERNFRLFFKFEGANAAEIVANGDWLDGYYFLDFLRDVGKHFSVNAMLAKESVRSRIENREHGISFTEFSYQLLQAYDFFWLYQNKKCRLQIGGSDQWGNITAGIELIRRKTSETDEAAAGMTFPLLKTSAGTKFGKTEAGAVWLDGQRTSPYRFYQFWLNTADADVITYLKYYSFRSLEEIAQLEESLKAHPEGRLPQKALAEELTNLVHGKTETEKAIQASSVLFGGELRGISRETLLDIFADVPSSHVAEVSAGIPLPDLLVRCGLADSKGAARRLIEGGGLYLNNEKAQDAKKTVSSSDLLDGLLILRSGKKNYYLVSAI